MLLHFFRFPQNISIISSKLFHNFRETSFSFSLILQLHQIFLKILLKILISFLEFSQIWRKISESFIHMLVFVFLNGICFLLTQDSRRTHHSSWLAVLFSSRNNEKSSSERETRRRAPSFQQGVGCLCFRVSSWSHLKLENLKYVTWKMERIFVAKIKKMFIM